MSQKNFTIDDNDPVFVYGPGWGVDSSTDPVLDNYFQSTYHASQTLGANVSLSFAGVAIYLYGSKGPSHGSFFVRYDNFIQLLSAQADTLSYRQLLFSTPFPDGVHSITLTNTDNNNSWLDLDYVTVTEAGNTPLQSAFSSTISPLSVAPTTTQVSGSSPAPSHPTVEASSSQPHSKLSNMTLVFAIVFGVLLFFLVVGVVWYLIRRARSKPSPSPRRASSAGFYPPLSDMTTFSPYPSTYVAPPLGSPKTNTSGANISNRRSSVVTQHNSTPASGSLSPATLPWNPFSTSIGRIFSGPKDGADSMKSTFLKV